MFNLFNPFRQFDMTPNGNPYNLPPNVYAKLKAIARAKHAQGAVPTETDELAVLAALIDEEYQLHIAQVSK